MNKIQKWILADGNDFRTAYRMDLLMGWSIIISTVLICAILIMSSMGVL